MKLSSMLVLAAVLIVGCDAVQNLPGRSTASAYKVDWSCEGSGANRVCKARNSTGHAMDAFEIEFEFFDENDASLGTTKVDSEALAADEEFEFRLTSSPRTKRVELKQVTPK